MGHCVYIRLRYPETSHFLHRFALMQQTSLPSLVAQDAEFDVQVKVHDTAHARIVESFTPFRAVIQWNLAYDIQTRHDSDDIALPGYISRIQKEFTGVPKIVTAQYLKFDWHSGVLYRPRPRDLALAPSMFSSVLSPPDGVSIWSQKHNRLGDVAPVTVLDGDWCRLVIHGANVDSKPLTSDEPVDSALNPGG